MGIQGTPNMGMVIFAAIIISLALVFYTIGVFAERRSGTLRPKHLAFFWTGFVFDTAGTTIMSMSQAKPVVQVRPSMQSREYSRFRSCSSMRFGQLLLFFAATSVPGPTSIV